MRSPGFDGDRVKLPTGFLWIGAFVLIQIGVMLVAISSESLWIDEFVTAYFTSLRTLQELYEMLLVPSGSQTPLHFAYYFFWGKLGGSSELFLRFANIPLFVLGQLALYWALRSYSRNLSILVLVVGALHPMVWMYTNEARQYIMMYAGAQMILAYMINLHAEGRRDRISPLASAIFVVGAILLFGSSLLGAFWVFSAFLYIAYFHYRNLDWRYLTRGASLLLVLIFAAVIAALLIYYVNSLLQGAGASRLSSTTAATVAFAIYELLGLSGVGPSRLQLRATGAAALGQYTIWLIPMTGVVLVTLTAGLIEAKKRLGATTLVVLFALALFPVAVVVTSGFVMHWRVLGRHLIAMLPVVNLLLAVGMASLLVKSTRPAWMLRSAVAVACLLLLTVSSLSLRFSERHRKDDYRSAVAIAQEAVSKGQRVWWAAANLGANHYGLAGEFDFMGEMTGATKPIECADRSSVQPVAHASANCLQQLSSPDVVIFSKPDVFDASGAIAEYLKEGGFSPVQYLPAFVVWRSTLK